MSDKIKRSQVDLTDAIMRLTAIKTGHLVRKKV